MSHLPRASGAPGKVPTVEGTMIHPGSEGAINWYSPPYGPRTGLFYVSTWADDRSIFFRVPSSTQRAASTRVDGPSRTFPTGEPQKANARMTRAMVRFEPSIRTPEREPGSSR
jgi:hypothetical protein